jgi:hypothetical protein
MLVMPVIRLYVPSEMPLATLMQPTLAKKRIYVEI